MEQHEMRIGEFKKQAAAYRDFSADVLSRIVKVKSYSGQEEAVIREIAAILDENKLNDYRIDGLGSLILKVGDGDKSIAFDAHIDTVETGDVSQWDFDPFSGHVADGLVHGRGTSDQKGGAAAMITAARMLSESGYRGPFAVYFTFTVMEEDCDGMCWKYLIEEEGLKPDFVVSTEPTSCRIYRGHRGRMEMELRLKGLSAHGSAPERGVSAAYKASRAALALEKLNEELQPDDENFLGKGSIVVSQMKVAGPSQCAVPDTAMLYLDRRLTWGETAESAISQVRSRVADATDDDPADIDVRMPRYEKRGWKDADYGQELYFPTWKIDEDHQIVRSAVSAYRSLFDDEPVVDKWTFSTNLVATTGRHGIPAVGFGPGDENQAHAPNEINRVADLEICSAFYAALPLALEVG